MKDYCRPEDCSCIPGIKCDVKNCVYNDKSQHCTAESIKITPDHASSPQETACNTFRQS